MFPSLPLQPEPVPTRRGSWITAIEYYAKYFNEFSQVIDILDAEESVYIDEVKELLSNIHLKNDITFVYTNYNCFVKAIKMFETDVRSINQSHDIIDNIHKSISNVSGDIGKEVTKKLDNVLSKNVGLVRIRNIADILNGDNSTILDIDLNPQQLSCFTY